jgi:hypothetical protein
MEPRNLHTFFFFFLKLLDIRSCGLSQFINITSEVMRPFRHLIKTLDEGTARGKVCTNTGQHNTQKKNKLLCLQWGSNTQSLLGVTYICYIRPMYFPPRFCWHYSSIPTLASSHTDSDVISSACEQRTGVTYLHRVTQQRDNKENHEHTELQHSCFVPGSTGFFPRGPTVTIENNRDFYQSLQVNRGILPTSHKGASFDILCNRRTTLYYMTYTTEKSSSNIQTCNH